MDKTELLCKIVENIADLCGVSMEDITLTSNLEDDLGMDDLDVVELTMALEEEYPEVEFPLELSGFTTVQDVYDYMLQRASGD